MDETELVRIVGQVGKLLEEHYIFPEVATAVSGVLATGLAEGRYPADARALATAVTADLQSVNGDKHLRLLYHDEVLQERTPGDDAEEYAALAGWADQTCGGVASVQRLAGNVGYLELRPILFPAVICGELITGAVSRAWPFFSPASSGTTNPSSSPGSGIARTTCSSRRGRSRTFPVGASGRPSRYT